MRAAIIREAKGPKGLSLGEVSPPSPSPEELLVRVRATALNRADLLQTKGLYPAPPGAPPDIPGLEYAGEVAQVGPRVSRFRPGDRVMGLVGGGAFAELLVCHEREALPAPPSLSFEACAAFPEAFLTAFDALCLQGKLCAGEWVLVRAAGSGVGTAACQIAKAVGATVIGTSRTPQKLSSLGALGMDHGILTSVLSEGGREVFAERVHQLSSGRGVDVVLDLVGGAGVDESLRSLSSQGRLLLVGLLGGARAEVDLSLWLRQRLTAIGTVLRSRPLEEKIVLAQKAERGLLPLLHQGKIRPVIDSVFPLEQLEQAFSRLSSNASFGKVVLRVDG